MGFQPTVTKLAKAPRPIAKGDVVRRTHTQYPSKSTGTRLPASVIAWTKAS
ncbi:hypothetical protein [Singulisphaera sp. GP187]|uniref:hypothetical protein n=1 Tax=Singulisphaera sp. GP187 TaxID=1882752 RepID=UPI0013565B03|nr:hypothetical protein [Singulisphaera sp. GP187]